MDNNLSSSLVDTFSFDEIRQFEYEEGDSEQDTTFELFSILKCRKFWYQNLVMPKIVWDSLRGGLNLWQFFKFGIDLPVRQLDNNLSALNECSFVELSIADLLKNEVIKVVNYQPHCVNPLTVAYRKGKRRMCLDLSRLVNPFLCKQKFRLDGLPTLSETFATGFWFFTFDIKR